MDVCPALPPVSLPIDEPPTKSKRDDGPVQQPGAALNPNGMSDIEASKEAARAWLGRERRAGYGPARPIVALGLLGTILAIGQAFCAAWVLTGISAAPALAGFAVLAAARAVLMYAADRVVLRRDKQQSLRRGNLSFQQLHGV